MGLIKANSHKSIDNNIEWVTFSIIRAYHDIYKQYLL